MPQVVEHGENLLVVVPTGACKSWVGSALTAGSAPELPHRALFRLPDLLAA